VHAEVGALDAVVVELPGELLEGVSADADTLGVIDIVRWIIATVGAGKSPRSLASGPKKSANMVPYVSW